MDVNFFFTHLGDDTIDVFTDEDLLSDVSTVDAHDDTPNRGVRCINAAADGAHLYSRPWSLGAWLADPDNAWVVPAVRTWAMISPWRRDVPTGTGVRMEDLALFPVLDVGDPEEPWWLEYATENRYQPLEEDQLSP